MSEKAPRQPMTEVEHKLLDIIHQLQDCWAESVGNVMEHTVRMQGDMRGQIAALTHEVHELSEQIKELRQQLTKERLF
jgi:hypothetical protein